MNKSKHAAAPQAADEPQPSVKKTDDSLEQTDTSQTPKVESPQAAENAENAKAAENADVQITSPEQKPQKQKRTAKQWAKYFAHRYFIEAFSGMALGLFCTLIIGTVIAQFGIIDKDNAFCKILANIGGVAKLLMGAGIGVGIAHSLKANKLTSFSAAVAGMVGANITNIFALSGVHIYGA